MDAESTGPALIGFVTGLQAEARVARRLGLALAGGGTPDGARRAAAALVDAGATALVSFGLAGGLDPALRAGAVVVPLSVVGAGTRFATDPKLCRWLGSPPSGTLAAETAAVATVAAKARLRALTGADAVDLESGVVAEVASARGVPFAALRAICDPATRDLPPTALVALDASGAVAGWSVAKSLFARPGDIAGLLALARDATLARRALVRRVRQILNADRA